jgi:predicted PurR-regulated permease PerM
MNTPVQPGGNPTDHSPDTANPATGGDSKRALLTAARLVSFALVCGLLYWGRVVAMPVALAVLFSFMLNPLVKRFQRARVPRGIAVSVTMVVAAGGLIAVGAVIGNQLASLSHDLPRYKESIVEKIKQVRGMMRGGAVENIQDTMKTMATEFGNEQPPKEPPKKDTPNEPGTGDSTPGKAGGPLHGLTGNTERAIPVYLTTPQKLLEFEGLASLQPVVDILTTAGLVFLLVIMMLLRWEDMRSRLISFSGHKNISVATRACDDAGHRITRYLMMQMIVNGSYGAVVTLALYLLGVPYAAMWGVCAALFRYVPYAGPVVAALLPLTFSFVTSADWQQPLWVAGVIIVLELVSNNVIEPWLYGANLGLSAMGIIIAAVAWTFLWGPVGLVMSTPLTVVLVVMGEYVPAFAIFTRLLGDKPVMEPHFQFYQRLLARDEAEATDMARQFMKESDFREAIERLFIPALALAKRDFTAGLVGKEDTAFVGKATEEIFESFRSEAEDQESAGDEDVTPAVAMQRAPVIVWPMNDLAASGARIFEWMLKNSTAEITGMPPQALLGEVLQEIRASQPVAICIINLSGSEVARTRQFVRRLRADCPGLPLIVARLGTAGTLTPDVRDELREAGATAVTRTLQESMAAILPYANHAAHPVEF